MVTTPRELFERLHAPDPPLILDVRNKEEFAGWKIEGPHMPETLKMTCGFFPPIRAARQSSDRTARLRRDWEISV